MRTCLSCSLFALAIFACEAFAEPQHVTIGATFALSGKLANIGEAERDGFLLAHEELGDPAKIRLLFEDNAGDPKTAVTTAQKLLDVQKSDIFISAFTHITQAVKAAAAHAGKPMVYISTASAITAENPLFFRDYYDVAAAGHEIVSFAARRGYRTAAYVRDDGEACGIHEAAASAEAQSRGLNILSREEFSSGTTDLRATLLRVKQLHPDTIIYCAWRDAATVIRQMDELGMTGVPSLHLEAPVIPVADTPEMRALFEKNKAVTTWYGYIEGSMTEAVKSFNAKYRARFQKTPLPDAVFAYDLAKALYDVSLSCLRREGFDQPCFVQKLASETFPGVSGGFSFGSDRNSTRPVLLMEVRNGIWVEAH